MPGFPRTPPALEAGLAERLLTPALVIDLGAARRNVAAVLALAAGPEGGPEGGTERWRPHVKTAKVPEVLALYVDAGIRSFKCATLREARVLVELLTAREIADGDVLLAHHLHGPARAALSELAGRFPRVRFSTLVESLDVEPLDDPRVGLFVDLDLGMARTGLDAARTDEVRALVRSLGGRFRGLHAYDGHRTEAGEARALALAESYDGLVELVRALGTPVAEVITAGTPAFPAALGYAGFGALEGTLHRISPGTVVYHDLRSVAQNPDVRGEWAATVVTRVASHPGPGLFTADAGSKAIEAAGPDVIAAVLEKSAVALRQSEEHTVFRATAGEPPPRGAVLRLVPGHVCPTVNLHESAVLVEDGRFVGLADVSARAHDAPIGAQ